jgi:Ca2+-binding EF-hand superfamily protein
MYNGRTSRYADVKGAIYFSSVYITRFITAIKNTNMDRLSPEEIAEFREIFNLVDKDGGGSITKVELAELMEVLGIDADPEEIEHMISEIDQGWQLIRFSLHCD